jgi:hypothetical protein
LAGYSGKPVVQKLGIKPGFRIFVVGAPEAYSEIVGKLPTNATMAARLKPPLDMVHVFATEAAGLAGKLRSYRDAIAPDGMFWVSWPKKSSGVATDLTESYGLGERQEFHGDATDRLGVPEIFLRSLCRARRDRALTRAQVAGNHRASVALAKSARDGRGDQGRGMRTQ